MSDAPLGDFRNAVQMAAARADVISAVERLYREVEGQVQLRRPLCTASGRCCRFEEFGHRLYATTMELAAFLASFSESPELAASMQSWDGTGCPFQIAGLCGVHAIRPFGCRIFFCDSTAAVWQEEQYQHFHAALKQLHDRLGVAYYYLEWRQALSATLLLDHKPRTTNHKPLPVFPQKAF